MQQARAGQRARSEIQADDGAWFDISVAPLVLDDRQGTLMIVRETTTDHRRQDDALALIEREAEAARLRDLSAFKTQLLNTVSHELNTPLTPLRLHLHMLRSSEGLSEKQQKSLNVLDRNIVRLSRLVTDVLDVARIEGGRLRITPTEVDVSAWLEQECATYPEPSVTDRLVIDAVPGVRAHLDPRRLSQVVYNFLSNAGKYAPEGTITCRLSKTDATIRVSVQDEGPGLSPAQIERLWQPFSRVHVPSAEITGTGLGLFIARGIVESHGGSFGCDSDPAVGGATFWVELPRAGPPAVPPTGPADASQDHAQDRAVSDTSKDAPGAPT